MDTNFFEYVDKLQLMAFFSAYAVIYIILNGSIGKGDSRALFFIKRLFLLLPYAYALSGSLFLGLFLKNISTDFSLQNIKSQFHFPYMNIFGLFSLFFWIPAVNKKNHLSLLHSLVFFLFIVKDLFLFLTSAMNKEIIQNDMKVFTDSLLLNLATLTVMVFLYYTLQRIHKPL